MTFIIFPLTPCLPQLVLRPTIFEFITNQIAISEIGSIELNQGNDSQFRLNVDGMHGQDFNDVEILAKDNIYVFIETTLF